LFSGKISYNIGGGVRNCGSFSLSGGEISGNSFGSYILCGGGVENEGAFKMTGGIISNNRALGDGGGVYNGGGFKNATFSMSGGVISGNTAENIDTVGFGDGGGVYNAEGGRIDGDSSGDFFGIGNFVMSGGVISNNKASNGGGVYNMGNFKITDGEISDNNATNYGGGVYNRGDFDRRGGTISGNTASKGNNVYFYNANDWLSAKVFGLRNIEIICACVVCVIGVLFYLRRRVFKQKDKIELH